MPRSSLRARLLRVLLPPVAVLLALGAVAAFVLAVESAGEAYDQALVDVGLALGERVRRAGDGYAFDLPSAAERALRVDRYDTIYFSVRAPDGALLAGERDLPPVPPGITPDDGVLAFDSLYRNAKVRVVSVQVACENQECTVSVAETTRKRARLIRNLVLASIVPALLVAALLLAMVWFGIRRGLAPLELLSEEIRSRSARELQPIDVGQTPLEALPLVNAINQLLERVTDASRNQQRFLANAAHQLRTPLAGLQAHTELALAQQPAGPVRDELEQVHSATVRTARLATQLLALARAEPGGSRWQALAPIDLKQLVETEADEWVHRALAKDIDLGFDLSAAPVKADPVLLRECLANLVHNAIEYTPRGGRVTVRTFGIDRASCLEVDDSGPGIPEAERERVLERFYRLPSSPGTGSGLGLAIVREIAAAHGATVRIGTPPEGHGCRVTLRFP